MIKYVVVAVVSICFLPCFAAAQDCGCGAVSSMEPVVMDLGVSSDCGCDAAPVADCGCDAPAAPSCAPRTRKRLSLTSAAVNLPKLRRTCITDNCGCQRSSWTTEKRMVNVPKLTLVDAPARQRCGCAGGRLRGMVGRLGSRIGSGGCGGGCGAAAPADDCGCGVAEPVVSDCGCGS